MKYFFLRVYELHLTDMRGTKHTVQALGVDKLMEVEKATDPCARQRHIQGNSQS